MNPAGLSGRNPLHTEGTCSSPLILDNWGPGCDCHELEGDGIPDLSMKFWSDEVVEQLQLADLPGGALVELVVTGTLLDGTSFSASDCIVLVGPGPQPGAPTAVNGGRLADWPKRP